MWSEGCTTCDGTRDFYGRSVSASARDGKSLSLGLLTWDGTAAPAAAQTGTQARGTRGKGGQGIRRTCAGPGGPGGLIGTRQGEVTKKTHLGDQGYD